MVLAADAPRTRIIETAPLVTIEILSPDDTLADLAERAEDYGQLGIAGIWILDPWQHKVYSYTAAHGLRQMPGNETMVCGSIKLDPDALFHCVEPEA
jgi:Uma2 family endonuclease